LADERILGDGDFVDRVLRVAQEQLDRKYCLQARGVDLDKVAERVCDLVGMRPHELWAKGKYPWTVQARSLLCYWAVRELGMSMAELSRKLQISQPAVSLSVKRGEKLAKDNQYVLFDE
jgi:DNA-binding Lrp family transcriptional regulator